ncbi:hypothetical protein V8G54_006013, partial [Vigna mungo]
VVEEVDLHAWTLAKLRDCVAERSNSPSQSINLICAGKILRDDAVPPQTLSQLGIKNNAKILATRASSPQQGISLVAEEELVAAFEAGGGVEQVLLRLTEQSGIEPTSASINTHSTAGLNGGASSSAPLPNNDNSDDHLSTMNEVEDSKTERDKEMEDELSADIAKADALADYDIEVNVEGEAITQYLALVESARTCGQTAPSQ